VLLLHSVLDFCFFFAWSYASVAYAIMRCVCLSVCPSVCLSRSWILSKRINTSSKFFSLSGSQTILVTKCHNSISTGPSKGALNVGGFWANIWLRRVLWTVRAPNAIHSAATDLGESMTLVSGKQRTSLPMDTTTKCMTRSLNSKLRRRQQSRI